MVLISLCTRNALLNGKLSQDRTGRSLNAPSLFICRKGHLVQPGDHTAGFTPSRDQSSEVGCLQISSMGSEWLEKNEKGKPSPSFLTRHHLQLIHDISQNQTCRPLPPSPKFCSLKLKLYYPINPLGPKHRGKVPKWNLKPTYEAYLI